MKYGALFLVIAGLLVIGAVTQGGWRLVGLWPAFSCGMVALGYLRFGPRVYGKSPAGVLSPLARLALLPFLVWLGATWHVLRLVRREPAFDRLTDTIVIGRRLFSRELPDEIEHVVDLTCEFTEPIRLRSRSYHSFPILDGEAPAVDSLCEWLDRVAELRGVVYIHCAEGHGRTGLFAACLLLRLGQVETPREALDYVRSKRPSVRLGRTQERTLIEYHRRRSTTGAA